MFMKMVFSKIHPACFNIANGIKPGSNSKKTDKHAADMWPKVSVSLIKKQFLFIQEKTHTSESF